MRLIIFMLFLFSSSPSFSTILKIEESVGSKVIYHDYNQDKKADLIEYYDNDRLVKSEHDEDFDGLMDITREFFYHNEKNSPFEIITKSDRILKLYRDTKINRIIKFTEIDLNGNGKYDLKLTDHYPIDQKIENCFTPSLNVSSTIDELNSVINKTVSNMDNGYIIGEYGHKIHKSCLNNYKTQGFNKIVTDSLKIGLACFENLAKKNTLENPKAPNGALVNLVNLKRIMKETPVTIACHEKDYEWDGTLGHASTSKLDEIKSLGLIHPFISLSPNKSDSGKLLDKEDALELKKTLFHEQLHNLGYRHGSGVEFPYACEACCFDNKGEAQAAACTVCRGQYSEKKGISRQYIIDMVNWNDKNHGGVETEKIIITYMKENPNDRWGLVMLARGNAGIFSPVGIEMAKIIKSSKANFSAEERDSLDKALIYSDVITIKKSAPHAKIIAMAYEDYYFLNNASKAMKILSKNKSQLKKIKKESGNVKIRVEQMYTNQKVYEDAKSILSDIWLENYPNNDSAENNHAYDLLLELGAL